MADTKISNLTELTVPPDPTDELVVVDKSDTSMAASGTDKRIQYSNLYDWAEAGDLSTIQPDDAAAAGTSVEIPRADHKHAIVAAVAGAIQPDDAAAEGSATSFARSDHKHSIDAAVAATLSGTNAEGSSTSFARADHNHAITDALITSRLFKPTFGVVHSSGSVTLTTSFQDYTGCTATFSPATASTVLVVGIFDFSLTGSTVTTALNCEGALDVDGAQEAQEAFLQNNMVTASGTNTVHGTVAQAWAKNLTAASHTIKLVVKKAATGTGTATAVTGNGTMLYLVVSQ